MIRRSILFPIFYLCTFYVHAQQTHQYNLAQLFNERKLKADTAVKISVLDDKVHQGGITVKGNAWLKDVSFTKGTIDVDLRGKNVFLQSFLGIAFHGLNDSTYDVVYFRPFNFKHQDTARRRWSVQYMSMPDYDYEKLRKAHPLVYENTVTPVPNADDWFHATLVIDDSFVTVYVDHSLTASLKVRLLNNHKGGKIGLWSYAPGVSGDFANLKISSSDDGNGASQNTQTIPYGNNASAGNYFNVGDVKLYYEIYGKGKPMVLLHGGVYGYIDEFEPFIKKLSENFQVICIATRGHGKSEMGHSAFTYAQRADDAFKVIRSITKDSVIVLGFSDGAFSALKLAALHPEMVSKLIAIGTGDFALGNHRTKYIYTPESLMKSDSAFFASRLALMPEPKRWREDLANMSKMYNEDYVSTETFASIKCPTLIMAGDRDDNFRTEDVVKCAKAIHNAQLSIIPGCYHVVFYCNFPAVWEAINPFLKN